MLSKLLPTQLCFDCLMRQRGDKALLQFLDELTFQGTNRGHMATVLPMHVEASHDFKSGSNAVSYAVVKFCRGSYTIKPPVYSEGKD